MFRPKKVVGKDKARPQKVYLYTDGIAYAKQAVDYLRTLPEVEWATIHET